MVEIWTKALYKHMVLEAVQPGEVIKWNEQTFQNTVLLIIKKMYMLVILMVFRPVETSLIVHRLYFYSQLWVVGSFDKGEKYLNCNYFTDIYIFLLFNNNQQTQLMWWAKKLQVFQKLSAAGNILANSFFFCSQGKQHRAQSHTILCELTLKMCMWITLSYYHLKV